MKSKHAILIFILALALVFPATLWAATTAAVTGNPKFLAIDANGNPLSGGKLYTYNTGGTTTPKATWTDYTKATPNTNPVILDLNGEADVWIDSSDGDYRFVLKNSSDVVQWTKDNIRENNAAVLVFAQTSDYSQDFDAAITAIGATATTLYVDGTAVMSAPTTVPATCEIVITEGGVINQSTHALTINGQFSCGNFQQAFSGTGVVTLNRTDYMNPWWWGENTTPGTTDMTAEIQAALDAAYTTRVPVFYPAGTYLSGKLNYYGQSMFGVLGSAGRFGANPEKLSRILGKPLQDIFAFEDIAAQTQANLYGTIIKDLLIVVDDSVNASASFPNRAHDTVGNAAFSAEWSNGNCGVDGVDYTPYVFLDSKFENVNIESLSQAVGGQNASCGMFIQTMLYNCVFDRLEINRMAFGFHGDYPLNNVASNDFYNGDACTWIEPTFSENGWPFQHYNGKRNKWIGGAIYANAVGCYGMKLLSVVSSNNTQSVAWSFYNLYQELSEATEIEVMKVTGRGHFFDNPSLLAGTGDSYITWSADNCEVRGGLIVPDAGLTKARLKVSGDHNYFIRMRSGGICRQPWTVYSMVEDTGLGNQFTVGRVSNVSTQYSRELAMIPSREGAVGSRNSDFAHTTPSAQYTKNDDLFFWPSDITWTSLTPTITKDQTQISGEYVTIANPGTAYSTEFNRRYYYVGYEIPQGKVKVLIRLKNVASDSTQYFKVTSGAGATIRGDKTCATTTDWQTLQFIADFSSASQGDLFGFYFNSPAANQDIQIAWVALVPMEEDFAGSNYGVDSGVYDFDINGGSVGDHILGQIPDNTVITKAWYETITDPTSGGAATIALGVKTDDANGVVTATAYDNAIWNPGWHDGTPDGTAANFTTQTTAIRDVQLTIAGAVLTAGKIKVWWKYVVGE